MTRRWTYWVIGLFLISLLLFLPLRLMIGRLADNGFTARQVAGTIWYGRIGELSLKGQRLGTFEASLNPFALLTGSISMGFSRMGDPEGPLTGSLISGVKRGVRGTTGRVAVTGLFGALPLDAIQFDDVTILFRDGDCVDSSGRVTAFVAGVLPGTATGTGLVGSARCETGRVRLTMASANGDQKVELLVRPDGSYRGWMTVRYLIPEVGAALATAGFKPSSEGMMLSVDGRL